VVELPPLHIANTPVIVGVGSAFTVTVALAVAVQPFAFVTVTVYEKVLVGLTVIVSVVALVDQTYVE
jgi:hypothetical protein